MSTPNLTNARRQHFFHLLLLAGSLTDTQLVDKIRLLAGSPAWVLHRCACLRVLACRDQGGEPYAARRRRVRRTHGL